MRLIMLQSSQLVGVAYSPTGDDKGTLYVEFNNGVWYQYDDVPALKVLQVVIADSQGKAFDRLIKRGPYPFKKLEEEPDDLHV